MKEGHKVAINDVYCDGALKAGLTSEQAVVLPPGYPKEAEAVGERRIVLAGLRLAEVFKEALAPPVSQSP